MENSQRCCARVMSLIGAPLLELTNPNIRSLIECSDLLETCRSRGISM